MSFNLSHCRTVYCLSNKNYNEDKTMNQNLIVKVILYVWLKCSDAIFLSWQSKSRPKPTLTGRQGGGVASFVFNSYNLSIQKHFLAANICDSHEYFHNMLKIIWNQITSLCFRMSKKYWVSHKNVSKFEHNFEAVNNVRDFSFSCFSRPVQLI